MLSHQDNETPTRIDPGTPMGKLGAIRRLDDERAHVRIR